MLLLSLLADRLTGGGTGSKCMLQDNGPVLTAVALSIYMPRRCILKASV